jgi:predicted alpha/beta-fold hydrolase
MDHDQEVVALDIAFGRGFHIDQPVFFVLHGLNGGSREEYVKDFVHRCNANNSTVIVMVARGLMDLPIRGFHIFHGARWDDAHQAATKIKQGLVSYATSVSSSPVQPLLIGVGYSMGAIILSNMVARTGSECALDAAVAISGGLDMRAQIDNHRAQRLWQPMLCQELRDAFVLGKWGYRVQSRLTKEQMKQLMRATHVTEIDQTAVVAYHGFRDLIHYYTEMSALGDVPLEELLHVGSTIHPSRRIHNISVPLVVLHSMDDPIISWRTVAATTGPMHPSNLTRNTGNGNLMILLTKAGGHVGFPTGWLPFVDKWKWMSEVPIGFAKAMVDLQKTRTIVSKNN